MLAWTFSAPNSLTRPSRSSNARWTSIRDSRTRFTASRKPITQRMILTTRSLQRTAFCNLRPATFSHGLCSRERIARKVWRSKRKTPQRARKRSGAPQQDTAAGDDFCAARLFGGDDRLHGDGVASERARDLHIFSRKGARSFLVAQLKHIALRIHQYELAAARDAFEGAGLGAARHHVRCPAHAVADCADKRLLLRARQRKARRHQHHAAQHSQFLHDHAPQSLEYTSAGHQWPLPANILPAAHPALRQRRVWPTSDVRPATAFRMYMRSVQFPPEAFNSDAASIIRCPTDAITPPTCASPSYVTSVAPLFSCSEIVPSPFMNPGAPRPSTRIFSETGGFFSAISTEPWNFPENAARPNFMATL